MAGELKRYSVNGREFLVPDRYSLEVSLGQGAFGTVSSALDSATQGKVAIKKVERAFRDAESAKKIVRELRLLKHFLGHPNIISLIDVLEPQNAAYVDVYIITDLLETDLRRLLKNPQGLSGAHIQYFLSQILCGVEAIHRANVLHRDLKPENIFVNGNDCRLKIGDFGLARDGMQTMKSEYVVTRWYRSPELLMQWPYDKSIDIWSVGCIFAEMLAADHKPIFPGENFVDQLNRILYAIGTPEENEYDAMGSENAREYVRGLKKQQRKDLRKPYSLGEMCQRPYLPETVDDSSVDFLNKVLVFHPKNRPSATELRKHVCLGDYAYDSEDEEEEEVPEVREFGSQFEKHMRTVDESRQITNHIVAHFHPEYASKPGVIMHPEITAETAERHQEGDVEMYDAIAREGGLAPEVVGLLDLLHTMYMQTHVDVAQLNNATSLALQSPDARYVVQALRSAGLTWGDGFTADLSLKTVAAFHDALDRAMCGDGTDEMNVEGAG